jgi:hypothetical protein
LLVAYGLRGSFQLFLTRISDNQKGKG